MMHLLAMRNFYAVKHKKKTGSAPHFMYNSFGVLIPS